MNAYVENLEYKIACLRGKRAELLNQCITNERFGLTVNYKDSLYTRISAVERQMALLEKELKKEKAKALSNKTGKANPYLP